MKAKKQRAKSRRQEEREKMAQSKVYTEAELKPFLKGMIDNNPGTDTFYATASGNWISEEKYQAMSKADKEMVYVFKVESSKLKAEAVESEASDEEPKKKSQKSKTKK